MAKSIHEQIISGNGEIQLDGKIRNFTLPIILTGIDENWLQDAKKLIHWFNNCIDEKHPDGILLNIFHQAFGQARVNWSAEVKRQAKALAKEKEITEGEAFMQLANDCAIEWIPPVQGLPKTTNKEKVAQDTASLIFSLMEKGHTLDELKTKTPKELEELASK